MNFRPSLPVAKRLNMGPIWPQNRGHIGTQIGQLISYWGVLGPIMGQIMGSLMGPIMGPLMGPITGMVGHTMDPTKGFCTNGSHERILY